MSTEDELARRRDEIVARISAMARDFAEMVTATEGSNADDEHDPEGTTIAFERQQLVSLLEEAQRRLVDLDHAIGQVGDGTYGACEKCGGAIGAERLAARPDARACMDCVRSQ
ncbi:MAG TPA: TraR/DksA C4-type zinc finger protein [Mycobacteriales bacterium]|nr:TraR/DksA C4-type zinc finger protein [Mycobacteriales bacterium]